MTRAALLAVAGAAALAAAAPAPAAVTIFAHRGGPVVNGERVHRENTLPAFRAAARRHFGLELDVHLTKDGVPVVIHDGTFDRTTACRGPIDARTLASVRRRCPSVPTLARVLVVARQARVPVDVEINDYPTYPDWDSTPAFARRVVGVIRASGIPRARVIVQSFLPSWLDVALKRWPGVPTAPLSFQDGNAAALDGAVRKYRWVSPEWPVDAAYVARAHGAGLKIVPFGIDSPAAVRAARAAGVDALITDDPVMARRALG